MNFLCFLLVAALHNFLSLETILHDFPFHFLETTEPGLHLVQVAF